MLVIIINYLIIIIIFWRFLADLVLNGVLEKEGLQLLGSTLAYIVNTDKSEHVNINILMPICRNVLFDITGNGEKK